MYMLSVVIFHLLYFLLLENDKYYKHQWIFLLVGIIDNNNKHLENYFLNIIT